MAYYDGSIVEIPIGRKGLRTDDPNKILTPDFLIRALNCNYENGVVEKAYGSQIWNENAQLPAGVIAAIDYRANSAYRRTIVGCSDGRTYKFTDPYTFSEVSAFGSAPSSLNVTYGMNFVQAGLEISGRNRKLFVFTGNSMPQVIEADSATRRNISGPLNEWSGVNNPVDGIIFRNRLFCWSLNEDTVWASSAVDHESFIADPLPYEVGPGEAENISGAFVFKGKLFVHKYPKGVYVLDDSGATADDWYFVKLSDKLGGVSSRADIEVFNDRIMRNSYGGISSITGTDTLGDVASADLFAQLRVQNYVKQNLTPNPAFPYHAIYYESEKIAYFSYRGVTSLTNNQICVMDFSNPQDIKVSWYTKDIATCLFLLRDDYGVERPYCGSTDGYVYRLDAENRWIGTSDGDTATAYTMDVQTPHMDFGGADASISETIKQFDFLEVVYLPEGEWNLKIDVIVDGKLFRTIDSQMSPDKEGSELDTPGMTFDNGYIDPDVERVRNHKIEVSGRRISFRCYNDQVGQNCRIVALKVYFKILDNSTKR